MENLERVAGGGLGACGHVVYVEVLLARDSTAEIQRAAEPSGNLREDGGGAGARSEQIVEFHVFPGELKSLYVTVTATKL